MMEEMSLHPALDAIGAFRSNVQGRALLGSLAMPINAGRIDLMQRCVDLLR